jgi:hypothetical protein
MTAIHMLGGDSVSEVSKIRNHDTGGGPCACNPVECFGRNKDGSPLRIMWHNALGITDNRHEHQAGDDA